jgi:hypothetical protein
MEAIGQLATGDWIVFVGLALVPASVLLTMYLADVLMGLRR